jgi:hypothetical protein
MEFVDAFDAIFGLAATWKLLYHFKNIAWRKTIEPRLQANEISDLEFMGRHRFVALCGRITAGYLNSVDMISTGAPLVAAEAYGGLKPFDVMLGARLGGAH